MSAPGFAFWVGPLPLPRRNRNRSATDFALKHFPIGGLIQGSDGDFYGTTSQSAGGYGSIFRLHVPGAAAPQLRIVAKPAGWLSFSWIPLRGRAYQLQYSTNLTLGNWTDLGVAITSTNSPATASDPMVPDAKQRFYRLLLLP
jgi:hypothetical protein